MSALDSYLLVVGSVLDIGGVLSEPPEFLEVSDADAIASDWEALGLPIDAAPTDLPRSHGRQGLPALARDARREPLAVSFYLFGPASVRIASWVPLRAFRRRRRAAERLCFALNPHIRFHLRPLFPT